MVEIAQLFDTNEIFDSEYEYFYKTNLTEEQTIKEVNILKDLLDLETGMKILDIPCGSGRLSKHFAQLGCEVVGVDINKLYLENAQIEANSFGFTAKYACEDMRDILYSKEFDIVLNWHNSFGYFDDYENKKILLNLKNSLKPGGRLVIEQVNRDFILKRLLPGGALWTDALVREDNMMIDRIRYNNETGRMDVIRVSFKEGKSKKKSYSFRLFTFPELRTWLLNAGFSNVEVYSEKGKQFTLESKRMIVVAYN